MANLTLNKKTQIENITLNLINEGYSKKQSRILAQIQVYKNNIETLTTQEIKSYLNALDKAENMTLSKVYSTLKKTYNGDFKEGTFEYEKQRALKIALGQAEFPQKIGGFIQLLSEKQKDKKAFSFYDGVQIVGRLNKRTALNNKLKKQGVVLVG